MISILFFFRHKRFFAPAFLYACASIIFSTWVSYIPYVADKLKITEGKIGSALFFTSLGSLTMLPFSNRLVDRLGVGRQAFYGFFVYAAALYGMILAPNYLLLCAALYVFGMCSSFFGIALNSLTATVEKTANRNIMTGSHGFWSMGGIIGASTGSLIAGILHLPLLHISILVAVLAGIHLGLRREYFYIRSEPHEKRTHGGFPVKPLLAIASISLIIMVSEGAIADWSALYLKKIVAVKGQFLGMGYALFAAGMTIGRFSGDALSKIFGSWKLMSMASGTSLLGFILVLLAIPVTSFPGFFIIGLGFSVIVPEVFRLASRIPGIRTADGVSFISATANMGFLTGPVVLGFIAELHSLRLSFLVLLGFVMVAFVMTRVQKKN
jgi:MFS family permease